MWTQANRSEDHCLAVLQPHGRGGAFALTQLDPCDLGDFLPVPGQHEDEPLLTVGYCKVLDTVDRRPRLHGVGPPAARRCRVNVQEAGVARVVVFGPYVSIDESTITAVPLLETTRGRSVDPAILRELVDSDVAFLVFLQTPRARIKIPRGSPVRQTGADLIGPEIPLVLLQRDDPCALDVLQARTCVVLRRGEYIHHARVLLQTVDESTGRVRPDVAGPVVRAGRDVFLAQRQGAVRR